MNVAIIDYGAGNIQSIQFAFRRLGIEAILSHDTNFIQNADKVIFPGVGEASSAMQKLLESGLDKLIPTLQQPVLGICLGMQLLCKSTEENHTKGLGIFDVVVKRFPDTVKVPQIGWNTVEHLHTDLFKNVQEQSYMYLVHSYYAEICPETIARGHYALDYSLALQKDNFYGVQFHPEKSSQAGEQLLQNFLEI